MRSIALLTLLALVACSGGDDEATGPADEETTTTTVAAGSAGSAGCDAATVVAAGQSRVDLGDRCYLRNVPPAHADGEPVPVVLDLHGYAEGAEVHALMSALGPFGDAAGFVTVTPHGEGAVAGWDIAADGADVDFIDQVLDDVEATLCVDRSRVYATGLSYGAFMTSTLACTDSERFAAVAPVAGVQDPAGCDPARPVPVLTFHGTDDEFVNYDGGFGEAVADLPAPDGSDRTLGGIGVETDDPDAPSVPEITAAWARRNGCEAEPTARRVATDVVRVIFGCPAGADVELYRVEGGGHSWPGSEFSQAIENIVGPTTTSIDANEVMWDFFQAHRLEEAGSQ
jgi:polyhydroxybutyrate depolymerase